MGFGSGGPIMLFYLVIVVVAIFYWLLPLFIYWRCGRILRRLERLELALAHVERLQR